LGRTEKMTFNVDPNSQTIRAIKRGEPKFMISEGMTIAPRASLEISKDCPYQYKTIIETCYHKGWLIPVAYVKDTELFWEEFSK